MLIGKIVRWKPDGHYGFVQRDDVPTTTFVHGSELDFSGIDTGRHRRSGRYTD